MSMPRYNLRGGCGGITFLFLLIGLVVQILDIGFWATIEPLIPHCLIFLLIFVVPFFIGSLTSENQNK
jgi:hypothetical protein